MAAEQFSAMTRQRTPVLEMPSGDILHIGYNRDADTLDVGTATNAGLAVSHSFPYDHDNSLDSNLQSVNEKLNEMEQYQKRRWNTAAGCTAEYNWALGVFQSSRGEFILSTAGLLFLISQSIS